MQEVLRNFAVNTDQQKSDSKLYVGAYNDDIICSFGLLVSQRITLFVNGWVYNTQHIDEN